MRKINVNKVIDEAKFNSYFLIKFVLLLLALIFDGYDMRFTALRFRRL